MNSRGTKWLVIAIVFAVAAAIFSLRLYARPPVPGPLSSSTFRTITVIFKAGFEREKSKAIVQGSSAESAFATRWTAGRLRACV